VRGEILRMDPSLDLECTYAYIRCEANRRILLISDLTTSDSVAILACRNTPHVRHSGSMVTSRSFDIGNKQSGSSRCCTHYGDTGYTKSRCYDLIGYPEWWDPSKAPKHKSKTSPVTSSVSITIAKMSSPNTNAIALHISSESPGKSFDKPTPIRSCAWIIDFGSTDHMSFDISSISKLNPSEKYVVSTANGTQATVVGKVHFL